MKSKENKTEEGFASRLLSLRRQKNLSQTALGKIVGIHYSHIGRYDRGISRPAADTLKRMANALGVSGDYLIEGTTVDAAKAKFENRELLLQFQEVEKLQGEDKQVVKKLIDAFLTKKTHSRAGISVEDQGERLWRDSSTSMSRNCRKESISPLPTICPAW
jgi:transcriptional regulator with XRE-family HTH domain